MRTRRPILLGLALLAASLLAGPALPTMARADEPLPECRYLDVVTTFHAPSDWERTLVDTIFMLPRSYVPPDLVPVSDADIPGSSLVRALVIPDLGALAAAARAARTPIAVQSGYRSYASQVSTFQSWVDRLGPDGALEGSARPGHSEHQLGVAIDFMSAAGGAPWDGGDWAATPAGAWMAGNAWRFGFVMSYPSAASRPVTCYAYEPWHYRYLGRNAAAAIHQANVTPREYLWSQLGNSVMASLLPGRGAASEQPSASVAAPTQVPTPAPTAGSPNRTVAPAIVEGGVAGTTGGSGQPAADPISPPGVALAVAIGLAILVAVEQLDRTIRGRRRRLTSRPVRRRASWDQARRSSSIPSP